MKKIPTLLLALFFVLSLSAVSYGQFSLDAHLSLGNLSFNRLDGQKVTIGDWSTVFQGSFKPTDDALITLSHSTSRGRTYQFAAGEAEPLSGTERAGRSMTQATAGYLVLNEQNITLYAGLGYKLLSFNIREENLRDNAEFKFSGHNFIGHVDVSIKVMDNLHAKASINGTPWFTWEYTEGNQAVKNLDGGSAFNYNLGLEYQFDQGYSLNVGYRGGSLSIPEFEFDAEDIPATKGSFSGLSGGVSIHF